MSLARPWWLCGLLLLLPLVLLHLRRPALAVREVPSLFLWERLTGTAASDTRRLRRPRHPLLLLLQALVLAVLTLALAGPERDPGNARGATVFVVDDSFWMQAPGRHAALAEALARLEAGHGGTVAVVAAGATPRVVARGSAGSARSAAARLHGGGSSADLTAAVTLGAGLLGGAGGRLIVLRAPESAPPAIHAGRGQLVDRAIGAPADDQGIFAPRARCGIGPAEDCEVLATLRNGSSRARLDRYTAEGAGRRTVRFSTRVPARSSASIALTARPGERLRLRLVGHDALTADDSATIAVPGTDNAPPAATVTLVGDPTTALPLAQAFASVPGVSLQLRTSTSYKAGDARRSELVVLDGVDTAAGLPDAPAVLLIAPHSLPGGTVGKPIPAPAVSSIEQGSPLLAGVDLASLNIGRNAATALTLPDWMAPVVSSPGGPLLAAGDDGHRRVAVLAFDPNRSNLSQLSALPLLARNLVGWADGWASLGADGSLRIAAVPGLTRATVATGAASQTLTLADGPAGVTDVAQGTHTITATGAGTTRRRTLVSALPAPATGSPGGTDLAAWAHAATPGAPRSLVPWLLVLALGAMAAEWTTWWRISR